MKKIKMIILFLLSFQFGYSQEKEVSFDTNYIKTNDGKTTIEINEVQELIYTIFSLTKNGDNPNIINKETAYYKAVQENFKPFFQHEIVFAFDKLLEENIVNFILLPGNAYGFRFDDNKIVATNVYKFPAKGIGKYELKENPIINYISLLEDFANKSNFRKFYKENKSYYLSLKKDYEKFAEIAIQKKWIESKFDTRINSYRVLTSPLLGSINATHTFEDNDFKEILLFLPTIKNDETKSDLYKKMLNIRIIFTEIDHNYVGPVSEKYKEKINSIFNQRSIWVDESNKGTQHYPNPIKLFDEYLTWSLYTLYAFDHFEKESVEFKEIMNNLNEIMVEKRGFIKFKEFNLFLLEQYKTNNEIKIEKLYPMLLEWSEKQNKF